MQVAVVLQKCNIFYIRTITQICTRSKSRTEVLIQKLLRFCILMRPAISFLKSKNFQFFEKKKSSFKPYYTLIWTFLQPVNWLTDQPGQVSSKFDHSMVLRPCQNCEKLIMDLQKKGVMITRELWNFGSSARTSQLRQVYLKVEYESHLLQSNGKDIEF